jgi:hypothetical protein
LKPKDAGQWHPLKSTNYLGVLLQKISWWKNQAEQGQILLHKLLGTFTQLFGGMY